MHKLKLLIIISITLFVVIVSFFTFSGQLNSTGAGAKSIAILSADTSEEPVVKQTKGCEINLGDSDKRPVSCATVKVNYEFS